MMPASHRGSRAPRRVPPQPGPEFHQLGEVGGLATLKRTRTPRRCTASTSERKSPSPGNRIMAKAKTGLRKIPQEGRCQRSFSSRRLLRFGRSIAMFRQSMHSHNDHIHRAHVPQMSRAPRWTPADLRPRKLCRLDVLVCKPLLVSHLMNEPVLGSRVRISRPIAYIVLYVALYAAFGAASPFWPKFFETRALTAQQIGLILGAAMLVRLAAGPLVGMLADLLGSLRLLLATCAALAAATAAAFFLANTFWYYFL
jgi:hypothetical protein